MTKRSGLSYFADGGEVDSTTNQTATTAPETQKASNKPYFSSHEAYLGSLSPEDFTKEMSRYDKERAFLQHQMESLRPYAPTAEWEAMQSAQWNAGSPSAGAAQVQHLENLKKTYTDRQGTAQKRLQGIDEIRRRGLAAQDYSRLMQSDNPADRRKAEILYSEGVRQMRQAQSEGQRTVKPEEIVLNPDGSIVAGGQGISAATQKAMADEFNQNGFTSERIVNGRRYTYDASGFRVDNQPMASSLPSTPGAAPGTQRPVTPGGQGAPTPGGQGPVTPGGQGAPTGSWMAHKDNQPPSMQEMMQRSGLHVPRSGLAQATADMVKRADEANKKYNEQAQIQAQPLEQAFVASSNVIKLLTSDPQARAAQEYFSTPNGSNVLAAVLREGVKWGPYGASLDTTNPRLNMLPPEIKAGAEKLIKEYAVLKNTEMKKAYFPGLRTTNLIAGMEAALAPDLNTTPEATIYRIKQIQDMAIIARQMQRDWKEWSAQYRYATFEDFKNTAHYKRTYGDDDSMAMKRLLAIKQSGTRPPSTQGSKNP